VLIHGLTGSHRASYVQRLAGQLLPRGLRVVRMDLRGAGHGFPLARRPYHAGCSDDLRAALAEVHCWSPASPIVTAGFSLGGNVALKLAGEASTTPVPGLTATAAVGPPIDLKPCLDLVTRPRNRFYEQHFVRHLVALARRRHRYFKEPVPLHFPRGLGLQRFDDLYTAPRSGFASALDYYERASALPLIPKIAVPTLMLTARDDPFIAVEPFESLTKQANVEVRILERGGHLGFLGWDGAGGIYWAERRIVEWITRVLGFRSG
jgi:predicted alpha/beta-fold hydrolase